MFLAWIYFFPVKTARAIAIIQAVKPQYDDTAYDEFLEDYLDAIDIEGFIMFEQEFSFGAPVNVTGFFDVNL